MKKNILIFVVALLPFLGFGQVDLVRWNGSSDSGKAPNVLNSNVEALSVTSGFSSLIFNSWGSGNSHFNATTISTSSSLQTNDYVQFAIKAKVNYQIAMDKFKYTAWSESGNLKYQVRYTKNDPSFTGNNITTIISESTLSTSQTQINVNLSGITVNESETLYLRIYVYNKNSGYDSGFRILRNPSGSGNFGPTFTGTVSNAVPPVLTAVNDNVTVSPSSSTVIDVLSNDIKKETVTVVSPFVQPAQGSITVNPDKTITYTSNPGTTLGSSDSFQYQITDGTITSTATVNITLQYATPTSGPLCGEYYVGTNGHFATLTQAVNYLNTNGVSCAVTFLLTNALYENVAENANGEKFPLTINAINTTAVNTVTFKPAPNKNVTVKVNNIIVSNNLINPLSMFKLNGTDNVIFEGKNGNSSFTIINNDHIESGNERTVFWLTNSTNNIKFQNLIIKQGFQSDDYAFSGGIFQGSQNTIGGQGSNASSDLFISKNTFQGLKQGVYVDNPTTNCVIIDNTFGNETDGKMQGCVYLINVSEFDISRNQIKDVKTNFSAQKYMAVYVNGKKGNIYKNTIYNIRRTDGSQSISGIRVKSTATNASDAITISNNFITDLQAPGGGGSDQGAFGIRIEQNSKFVNLYHNSVNLKQDFQVSGLSGALFVETNAKNLDVRNNIFNNKLVYNAAGRASIIIQNPNVQMFTYLDYNNYFSTSGVIGINGSVTNNSYTNPSYLQSLDAWKTAVGKDAHSTNVAPVFVDENNDLHLVAGNITNVQSLGGVAGLGILDDIDGEERYESRPTMGADEIEETRCAGTVTWNGSSWSNGQPNSWEGDADLKIIIAGAYNFDNTSVLNSCQLEVANGVTLTIKEGATYTVQDKLTLNKLSKMIIENNGSFVQVSDKSVNSIFKVNDPFQDAVFTVKRYTQPVRRYDYTYWSSPVQEADWSLYDLSPNTLLDKYMSYNPAGNWVVHLNGNEQMETGRGYIVRAPQNFPMTEQQVDDQTHFEGTPNNGPITFQAGGPETFNLLGNPYASAISADAFIEANSSSIRGTLYFWTHNTPVTGYVYTAADYASYNLTGGVAAQSQIVGGEKPTGKIASGQAFFVERTASANNTINYSNKMRVVGENNQFFKPTPTEMDQTVYKNRFWINVSNANHAYSELLVGYVTGATDAFDDSFDGKTFGGAVISMYSLLDETALAIQGKSLPFEDTDVIPLGYTTTTAGEYTINMNQFDGVFETQNVYLKDKLNNTLTNLKELNYAFTTQSGTFNNRFEIVFQSPEDTLGTETPILDANAIVVFKNGNQINVKSNELTLDQVIVYDLLGRVIFTQNGINAQEFSIPSLAISNQVVVVKVITDTKAELIKKVILD